MDWMVIHQIRVGARRADAPRLHITGVPDTTKAAAVREALDAAGWTLQFSEAGVAWANHSLLPQRRWPPTFAADGRLQRTTWEQLTGTTKRDTARRITLPATPATHAQLTLAARAAGLPLVTWALNTLTTAAQTPHSPDAGTTPTTGTTAGGGGGGGATGSGSPRTTGSGSPRTTGTSQTIAHSPHGPQPNTTTPTPAPAPAPAPARRRTQAGPAARAARGTRGTTGGGATKATGGKSAAVDTTISTRTSRATNTATPRAAKKAGGTTTSSSTPTSTAGATTRSNTPGNTRSPNPKRSQQVTHQP